MPKKGKKRDVKRIKLWSPRTSAQPQEGRPSKKKRLIFMAVILLVIAGAGIALYLYWNTKPAETLIDPEKSLPAQIAALDNEQIEQLATSDAKASKDYTKAHAKALALTQKGDYAASATVYKALVDTGKADHDLYVEYAAALYYSGDKQGAIRTMETVIEKVKASNAPQAEKDSTLRIYNNYLSGYRDEANQ